MRVRYALLGLCISLLTQFATAAEEEELPELELLGFIADFSDDEEGWVDPEELDEMFSPGERAEGSTQTEGSLQAEGSTENSTVAAEEPGDLTTTE